MLHGTATMVYLLTVPPTTGKANGAPINANKLGLTPNCAHGSILIKRVHYLFPHTSRGVGRGRGEAGAGGHIGRK